jgi:hypothetical protein
MRLAWVTFRDKWPMPRLTLVCPSLTWHLHMLLASHKEPHPDRYVVHTFRCGWKLSDPGAWEVALLPGWLYSVHLSDFENDHGDAR